MLIPSPLSNKCTPFRNMQNDKTSSTTMTASTPVSSPLVRGKATSPESTSQNSNCSITSSTSENTSSSQNRTFIGTGIENQINRNASTGNTNSTTSKTSNRSSFSSKLNVNTNLDKKHTIVNNQSNSNTQSTNNNQTNNIATPITTNVDVLLKSVVQRSPLSDSPIQNSNNVQIGRSTNFSIEAIMSKNPNVQVAAAAMLASTTNNNPLNSIQSTNLSVSPITNDVQCTNNAIQAQLSQFYHQQQAALAAQLSFLNNPLTNSSKATNSTSTNHMLTSPISPTTANSALFSQLQQLTHLGHLYQFPLQNFSNLANLQDHSNLNGLTVNSSSAINSSSTVSTNTAISKAQLLSIATQQNAINRSINSPTVYMDSSYDNFRCSPASSELTNTSIENVAVNGTSLLSQSSLELLRNSTPTDRINIISSPVQSRLNGDLIKVEELNTSNNKATNNSSNLNNSTTSNGSHKTSDVKCSSALSTTSSSSTTSNSPNPWEEKLKPKCNCKQLAGVNCYLENKDLWDHFNELGTEVIITKTGSMFPTVKVTFTGIEPDARYLVLLDIIPVDNKRYRYAYHKSSWMASGKADPPSPPRLYLHPDASFTGEQLRKQVVSFEKVKLTNNEMDKLGHIVLNSMHRYQPRIHLIMRKDNLNDQITDLENELYRTFVFPENIFIAVTAYQNQLITKLKIDKNPFAKGFRDSSRLGDMDRETIDAIMMNGYCRQTSTFPPFLLESQRAAAACAAASLSPLTQLGLSQMSQFGQSFNPLSSQLNQLNANEVYNLLTGCFPFYPNPSTAHLMGRTGQNATGHHQQPSPNSALNSSIASNPALALAQYQQLQQPPQ